MTDGRSSARRGVLVSTLGNLAVPVSALVTAPVLAQALGVDGRGVLASATAPFLLASAGLTFGLPDAMTYFTAKQFARGRVVLGVGLLGALVLGLLASLIILFFAPVISKGDEYVTGLITIIGCAVPPAMMAGVVRGAMRGRRLWHLIALDQVVSSLARVVAITVLAVQDLLTPMSAGIVTAAATFFGVAVYAKALRDGGPVGESSPPRRDELGPRQVGVAVARFGSGVWLGSVAGVLLARVDQVLLLPLASASALGLYAVAVSIADVVRVFNVAVRDVVFSTQSAKEDDEKLGLASRVSTLTTLVAASIVWGMSWVLVPLLFGEAFRGSIELVGVLLLGTVVGNVGSVLAAGLSARGRPILRSVAILVGVIVNVVLLVILAPSFGAMGAAVAGGLANALTGLVVLVFASKYFDLAPTLFLGVRRGDLSYVGATLRSFLKKGK